jgi:hypothetical protein
MATVTVLNNTRGQIHVAVARGAGGDLADDNGGYFAIEAAGEKTWARAGLGATAFVIRGNRGAQKNAKPEIRLIALGETLVIQPL